MENLCRFNFKYENKRKSLVYKNDDQGLFIKL